MPSVSAIDRRPSQTCYPLQEDAELAEAVDPGRRQAAAASLVARQFELTPGAWTGTGAGRDGIGLLVLQGLLVLRVGVAGRHSAELLGEGDVLRRPDSGWATQLTPTHSWLVLESTRLAVLDSQFVKALTGYPQLAGTLFGRAALRSRQLAVNMAIVHQARVDVRLHMLLWHLAGRWGWVRSDGIVVSLLRDDHVTPARRTAKGPRPGAGLRRGRRSSVLALIWQPQLRRRRGWRRHRGQLAGVAPRACRGPLRLSS